MQHRSPLIFWLLLAATFSVDAVVSTWIRDERQFPSAVYVPLAFHALVLSQLSVVCIWSGMQSTQTPWTQIAPLFATIVAAMGTTAIAPNPSDFSRISVFTSHFGDYALHSVLLLAALWLLQRTKFWTRSTGFHRTWQYSLLHGLVVMTIVAVLTTLMRNNVFIVEDRRLNLADIGTHVALAVSGVVIWSLAWHWLLRTATLFGFVILLGVLVYVLFLVGDPSATIRLGSTLVMILVTDYLIHAIVLAVWLSWGHILPQFRACRDAQPSQEPGA
jgi:hypothetical protein